SGIGVFARQFGPRRGYYFGLAQKFGPGAATEKSVAAVPAYLPGYMAAFAKPPGYLASRISKDPIEAVWTWSGFYIGGNVGYSVSRFPTDTFYRALSPRMTVSATNSP